MGRPRLDAGAETIRIERQWNVKVRKLTPPKHSVVRTVAMTPRARDRLLSLPRESEWVFRTLRGTHDTPSSRSHHWNRVRCAAGFGNVDLYTTTRHHFAWYAWNVLGLDPADIAQHFGHQDGGALVRQLYGHFDQARARNRIRAAFDQAPAFASYAPTDHQGGSMSAESYHAEETCQIVTSAKGRRRVHELDTGTGLSICAERNKAAANHDHTPPLGPGDVDCVRCARITGRA